MSVEISLNTTLAEALNAAILPKLVEVGWGSGGSDDSALAEYIILMLVNGKTQQQIATELSGDLLSLSPDDPGVRDFSSWLFEQYYILNAQLNGGQAVAEEDPMAGAPQEESGDMDTDMASEATNFNAPTGPRSMRNGNNRGGRDKRMLGQVSKAMDRSNDNVLHRVRGQTGNERINTHGRASPAGLRGGSNRGGRNNNNNNNNLRSLTNAASMGGQFQSWPMQGQGNQIDVMAMLEQQSQMMFELSQQMMAGGGGAVAGGMGHRGGFGQQRRGKSLFERTQDPRGKNNNFRRGQNHTEVGADGNTDTPVNGEDVDMAGGKRESINSDETVCKYNLHCTNKDCKFAHQSPAAPPGTSIDVNDICTFGAACKNRKCVGRHPSPGARLAHQGEQDCKFFPNCQNPRCPFRHPSMPLCRNGADCTTANCKFTHVRTKCRFNPCLNPNCAFVHDEGQQGGFKDKVWTSEQIAQQEQISDRKFVDEKAAEELVKPMENSAEDIVKDTDVIV